MDFVFLTLPGWAVGYAVQAFIWLWIASKGNEAFKYASWAILLITTIIFGAGLFFEEVRQFFYTLLT